MRENLIKRGHNDIAFICQRTHFFAKAVDTNRSHLKRVQNDLDTSNRKGGSDSSGGELDLAMRFGSRYQGDNYPSAPIIKGRGNNKTIAVELCDFSVFYNQDSIEETEGSLKEGSSKIVIENGQVIKVSKDKKTAVVTKEVLTKKWTDWVDYWSVDFNMESRKEIIRSVDPKTEEEKEDWTGGYIFENEWQSFRTKKDRKLELVSAEKEVSKGRRKIAVKVVDIFGNDTTRVIEVNI